MPLEEPRTESGEIMIVAGEASGDMHGAALVRAMGGMRPNLRFCGMGGKELTAAGVELLYDAAKLAVVGAVEVLSHLGDILQARKALLARMRASQPALLILIDYPDFNLLLASQAKKLGIPIFYYISPQIWAWRKKRVHTIGRLADCVAVILPFEEAIYTQHGYRAAFVGHPLLDSVRPALARSQFLREHGLEENGQLIGLLPGSRKKEIQTLLPVFLETAAQLSAEEPEQRRTFLIPLASTIDRSLLDENGLAAYQDRIDVRVISEDRYSMMAACDACLAASGTVTLELALLRVPTVVAYRVASHTYWLGKLIIRSLPFFALPNLIAREEIVPELLQDEVVPAQLLAKLKPLLVEGEARSAMLAGFSRLRLQLGETGAAERAARLGLQVLDEHGKTNTTDDDFSPQQVELPLDGTLDLHQFRPGEVKSLLQDYLPLCQERGILQVRIIHGKGKGVLRRTVHAQLERMEIVAAFRLAGPDGGEWGATLVDLRPPAAVEEAAPGPRPRPDCAPPA